MQQQENSIQDHDLFDLLRERVEQVVDRKMKTPKDYDYLSKSILEKQHENISATTLKRMWGYLSEPVKPRISTLDILAGYVGAESWEDFCRQEQAFSQTIDDELQSSDAELKATDDESQETATVQLMADIVPVNEGLRPWKRMIFIVLPLLLIIGLCAFFYFQSKSNMITFADPAVKALCVAHWDTDGDGELSYEEAALVTDLKDFIGCIHRRSSLLFRLRCGFLQTCRGISVLYFTIQGGGFSTYEKGFRRFSSVAASA